MNETVTPLKSGLALSQGFWGGCCLSEERITRTCLLLLFLVLICGLRSSASGPRQKLRHGPTPAIVVGTFETSGGFGDILIPSLYKAAAKHSHSQRVQVNWDDGSGSYSEFGAAIYDPTRGTVEYFCRGDWNAGSGMAGDWYARNAVRQHFLFTGVNPAILKRAASASPNAPPQNCFELLRRYGCGKKKLRYHGVPYRTDVQ